MRNQQSHKQYGFEDIQRYLDGAMSPAEKHELERTALQDPFLSDAIEGFEKHGTNNYSNHQEEIAAAVLQVRESAPIVSISKRMNWMRIAALFIIMAGVGIFGYQNFKSSKSTVVAHQQEVVGQKDVLPESTLPEAEKIVSQPQSSLPKATIKNNIINNDIVAVNINKKKDNQLSLTPRSLEPEADIQIGKDADLPSSRDFTIAGGDVASSSYSNTREIEERADSIGFLSSSNDIQGELSGKVSGVQIGANDDADFKKVSNNNRSLQGVVIDENGKPLANVSVISSDKKNVVITDMKGKFSLDTKDSSKDATVAAVGYLTTEVKLSENASQNQFVLAPASATLSEVVVTGFGIKRESRAMGYATDKPGVAIQPIGGWESFHEYVRIKLGMDSLEYYSEMPGEEMTIEFTLDKEGNPSNVQILSDQGSEKADLVRRLIQSGPRWTKPEKRKKVRTTIPR